jgi:hypothetical protein
MCLLTVYDLMRLLTSLFSLIVLVLPLGCARPSAAPASAMAPSAVGDPVHRIGSQGHAQGWVDTRLYFGLGPADRPETGVSEAAWRAFLDKEVTPRFPAGLSVLDVYGQWQSKAASMPDRLRSKLLVIDYQDSAENRARIEAIRAAWKEMTGDESVMRVTEPADVSF